MRLYRVLLLVILMFVPQALKAFEPRPIATPFVAGFQEIAFHDSINGLDRKLVIWYPVENKGEEAVQYSPWDLFKVAKDAELAPHAKKLPVVLLSHGWKGNPHQLSWLVRGLVDDGFIVVAIQHRDFIDGKLHINHWLRARDLQIALDQFVTTSFAVHADLDRIGVAGFSLGGTTALVAAGGRLSADKSLIPAKEFVYQQDFSNIEAELPHLDKEMMASDWRDPRIQAALVIAPTWSWLFDEESLQAMTLPVYLVASEGDKVIVTEYNAGLFARLIPGAIYQKIPGFGGHYIFLPQVTESSQNEIDPAGTLRFLFEDTPEVDRAWLQYNLAVNAAQFFRHAM